MTGSAKDQRQPLRVLIVDDDRDTVRMMKLLLSASGFDVVTAYDGPAALDATRILRPNAVLLDLELPTLGGAEVARQIRATANVQKCLLIAISGYESSSIDEECFDRCLVKPVDHHMLVQLLNDFGNRQSDGAPNSAQ